MKLSSSFINHNLGDEAYLVATGNAQFSGVVKGNRTLGVIIELLKCETTETQIISAMKERFDAPEEVIAGDVRKAIDELRKIGAIDE